MAVKHLRIDNRLVHGQVVVTWLQATGADTLIVANDAIARDDFQRTILLAVAPPNIHELIFGLDEALDHVNAAEYADERVFLLVKTPADAVRLVQSGLRIQSVNVGNMAFATGAKRVSNTVFVTQADVDAFCALRDLGVEITARMMPTDRQNDFMQMLAGAKLLQKVG